MIRFNYFVAVLGIVGEFAAIYPKNAVLQDIFFGIFCMGAGMIGVARSQRFSEKLGISSEIPKDKEKEKKPIIAECIFLAVAILAEVALYFLSLPYTYTATVIAAIAIVWVSRMWRGRFRQPM